jgi:hypothetical protein
LDVANEAGNVVFETAAAGDYFVYFLPVKLTGGAFPVSHYQAPEKKADGAWKARFGVNCKSRNKARAGCSNPLASKVVAPHP